MKKNLKNLHKNFSLDFYHAVKKITFFNNLNIKTSTFCDGLKICKLHRTRPSCLPFNLKEENAQNCNL
jgi:hypothetical protein